MNPSRYQNIRSKISGMEAPWICLCGIDAATNSS